MQYSYYVSVAQYASSLHRVKKGGCKCCLVWTCVTEGWTNTFLTHTHPHTHTHTRACIIYLKNIKRLTESVKLAGKGNRKKDVSPPSPAGCDVGGGSGWDSVRYCGKDGYPANIGTTRATPTATPNSGGGRILECSNQPRRCKNATGDTSH